MQSRERRISKLVCTVVLVSGILGAQNSDWLKNNDRGNRYEGLIDSPHGARNYHLLGFFANRQSFSIENLNELKVRFYLPPNEPEAFLLAGKIVGRKHYLMKVKQHDWPKNGWNEFTHWDVSAVLKPEAINFDDIGVVIHVGGEDSEEVAPAIVMPANVDASKPITDYTLILSDGGALNSVDYTLTGNREVFHYKAGLKDRSVKAGALIEITIPARILQEGPTQIHVYGPSTTMSEGLSARFRFFHKKSQLD